MSLHWRVLLACFANVQALPSQGPGAQWIGINGGYDHDYTDKLGRVWRSSMDKWTPKGWGGWSGIEPPARYTNTWNFQCRNWPLEYEQDVDALIQHHSKEPRSGAPLSVRVNLQAADAPVSYYTVKWNFCEKNFWGGAKMDFRINGKLVKEGYLTKHHHTHTDIYHWKCIPTVDGMIELSIEGKDYSRSVDSWDTRVQARFSTIEFEKSLDGCGSCEGMSCGKGFCSASTFWDPAEGPGGMGSPGQPNKFSDEAPSTTGGSCHCDVGVTGDTCNLGKCATVRCNEPFGGTCNEGVCSCLDFHSGADCTVKPNRDQFGCHARTDVNRDRLHVSTLCLPEKIAGPAVFNHIFRGPSPMNAVADKTQGNVVYFSWTSDRKWGKTSNAGQEGRIYISKLELPHKELPILSASTGFDGFVRSAGIDMTEDGYVGTLCAKWLPSWYDAFNHPKGYSPMVLAVCEIDSADMSARGTPWRIGKQFQNTYAGPSTGDWGNYPLAGWFEQRSAGYGQLQYSPHHRTWTAWYGATIGTHTGYAMHTYSADAAPISDEEYKKYTLPVPRDQVESRVESFGDFSGGGRLGTGDHQSGSAWRYHPILKDIGLQKHNHGPVYMQQYGLETPAGAFAPPGHGSGRVEMRKSGQTSAIQEGSIRPCAEGWIIGFVANDGNVCAKVNKIGDITTWRVIETSVSKMPCNPSGHTCGDQIPGRMVRIAPLGSAEDAALCGSNSRFLFGYEKEDRSRWLVEVDGECNELSGTRQDVTAYTHWPLYQEWTTTRDGAVVWVTSWHTDLTGKFGPKNSPNGVDVYDPAPGIHEDGLYKEFQDGYRFGLTPDATNEAKITVYFSDKVITTSQSGGTTLAPTSTTSTDKVITTSQSGGTTLAPTSTTSTVAQGSQWLWTTLYSTGSFGSVHNSKMEFNRVFHQARLGIARRECTLCTGTHKDIYFRRKTQAHLYDAWEGLMVTWKDINFHQDFDIYSSLDDALGDKNAWQFCNGYDTDIGFPRDCGPSSPVGWQWTTLTGKSGGGQTHYRWSVQLQASTTSTTTTSSASLADTSIQSGDTVFLSTSSGTGNMIDIEGTRVQSRWVSRGSWQAITIERAEVGSITSGDTVYLKTHTGAHIDVLGEMVQARWNDQGDWQAMVIEKRDGSGPIQSDDVVCFRAHTGQRLDVEGAAVRARWAECGDWQAMRIEKEVSHAVFSGTSITFLAHTGNRLEVEGTAVQARWSEAGEWQTFVIHNQGGRAIFSGDVVYLQAHTRMMIDVQDMVLQARWNEKGVWQSLVIEKKAGAGAILQGDAIVLRAHTGKTLDVEGDVVRARFFERGTWQTLLIEKSGRRRLSENLLSQASLIVFNGMSIGILAVVAMIFASLKIVAVRHQKQDACCKVQPF